MFDERRCATPTSILVAVIVLGPAAAAADVSFIGPTTTGCETATPCARDADCTAGPDYTCETVTHDGAETRVCRPPRSAFCCPRDMDTDRPCPVGMRCEELPLSVLLESPICVPGAAEYCGSLGPSPRCHTGPGDEFPVAYEHGDCDGDGVPNDVDRSACAGPPEIGVVDGGTCQPIDVGCARGGRCNDDSTCELLDDESATYCHPDRDVLFCCPEGVCPGSLACERLDDTLSVCIPPECGTNLACVTDASGNPVPFTEGDCDGDGDSNGAERAAGEDPCPAPETDAGVPRSDAGTARDAGANTARDAGPELDASAAFDGGPGSPVQPSFAGGGGCACRGAPARRGSTPWLALAPLALLVATRRR